MTPQQFAEYVAKFKTTEEFGEEGIDSADNNAIFDEVIVQARQIVAEQKVAQVEIPVARWESTGGKYWVELYYAPAFHRSDGTVMPSAMFEGSGCAGSMGLGRMTEPEAIAEMQKLVDAGFFQTDANKTPMRRLWRVFRTSDGYTLYRSGNHWVDSPDELQVDLAFGQDESGHPTDVHGVPLDGRFEWMKS